MTEFIVALIALVLGLAGYSTYKRQQVEKLKTEVKKAEETVKKRETEIRTVRDVQTQISEIKEEPKPAEITPPSSGDSASHLERLNKLHEH
jgi:cell division protein FtsL